MVSRTVAFLLCIVGVQALVHRGQPAAFAEATPAKKEEATYMRFLKENAKEGEDAKKENAKEETVDNLHADSQEVPDMAEPVFEKMAQFMVEGHACISKEDGAKLIKRLLLRRDFLKGGKAEEQQKFDKTMGEYFTRVFKFADKDRNGCLTKAEYERMGDWEGSSPPGFEKMLRSILGKKALLKRKLRHLKVQFNAFDRDGDHQLSKAEADRFVSEKMPHGADIFAAADDDNDGFIEWLEFRTAGERIFSKGKNKFMF